MSGQRRGGTIQLQANGVLYDAKGNFTFNLGRPKREAIIGADRVHGFKETQQVGFIEGEITDRGDLTVKTLLDLKNATVTLLLANGKTIAARNAYYAGDGTGNTDEGNMDFRVEGEVEEI